MKSDKKRICEWYHESTTQENWPEETAVSRSGLELLEYNGRMKKRERRREGQGINDSSCVAGGGTKKTPSNKI